MLNVKYGLQLLTHNNRLIIQLFLSSEIGSFEVEVVDFRDFSLEILTFPFVPTVGISLKTHGNPQPQLQIDVSRSTSGVRKCS